VPLRKNIGRRDQSDRRLQFVAPSSHNVALGPQYRLKPSPGDIGGTVFLALPDFRVAHIHRGIPTRLALLFLFLLILP
jgi:hypothetical protein